MKEKTYHKSDEKSLWEEKCFSPRRVKKGEGKMPMIIIETKSEHLPKYWNGILFKAAK
jgi:hypothetical protein